MKNLFNKHQPFGSMLLLAFSLLIACSETPQHKPDLSKAEVLSISETKAKSEGYDTSKYNITGCYFEYTKKDNTWSVFYELKPPTPPGGHFLVSINDQTEETILFHGE